MKVFVYTNNEGTEYAICCEGDQVMRAVTAAGIYYPTLIGEYELGWDSGIEKLPAPAVSALGLKLEAIEGSDIYTAVCGICGRETKSEWVENTLSANEEFISGMGDEICVVGHLHYDCDEEETAEVIA